MKEMKICVKSLSTGVEKDWITPLEALVFMKEQEQKDGSEEFIIVDYDAPFEILTCDIEFLAYIMGKIETFSDEEASVFEAIVSKHENNFIEVLEIETLEIVKDKKYLEEVFCMLWLWYREKFHIF